MSQGSSFWRGKQYQELAQLHLPGPSVVIDVRRGTDHDPPLIWNIGIELEDLSTEMELNQVYRWRHLTNCIDLLKLAPLRWDEPEKEMTDFILTTRTGQTKSLQGKKALIDELVTEHLDVVRTNRIGAGRDQDAADPDEARVDPEQVTVRVFFLVDAEDTDSLVSADTYAKWLKSAYHEYEEFGRSGRDKRISTLAICMNADPFVHHPYTLAQYLNHASKNHPALDAVILLHTYGDDEAYIGGDIQSYQVELILYALLLLSIESLTEAEQDTLGNQSLNLYIYNGEYPDQVALPWPIFMMGISSLEYSARWGGRWLDYGLVAKIIEIMHETEEVDREDELGELREEVQKKFENWLQEVNDMVTGDYTGVIPRLNVFNELQSYLASSPFHGKRYAASAHELNTFSQHVSKFYTGNGNTLESSLEGAQLIPWQLRRDYMRVSEDERNEPSRIHELYQKLHRLRSDAAQLPALLFHRARGMLPRALRQLSELTGEVKKICEVAEYPPNLKEYAEQFNRQAEQECIQLQRLISDQRWPFSGRIQQQREESHRRLKDIAQNHVKRVQAVIAARVALVLLQEVGLYNPNDKLCLFHERLRNLDAAMKEAQRRASLQQQRAYRRLKVSLSQTQVGTSQTPLRLSLNNRRDWLNWVQIIESFEFHSKELESTPTYLDLLMKWLLRVLGGEKPLNITEQYLSEIKRKELSTFRSDKSVQDELHAYSTMLVAVLILFDTVSFDTASIQQLLDQYVKLKNSSLGEPSTLETNIMGLQSIIREAKATRSSIGRNSQTQSFPSFSLPHGRLLELILAAWVNNLYAEDPILAQVLDRSGILTRLVESNTSPVQALKDLQARNRLLGYRDSMVGDDLYYLLLASGEASNDFLKEVALSNFAHIRAVRFPDPEKLIYLHIHRIRQVLPGFVSPSQEQLSPNT